VRLQAETTRGKGQDGVEPDLRRRLATTALAECRRVYSWDAVGRQIMCIYADLQGQPQPAFDTVLPLTPCRFRVEPHLL